MQVEPESSTEPSSAEPGGPPVLQVLPALVTGGVERGTVDIAGAVAAHGWESLVASSGGPMVRTSGSTITPA